MAALKITLKRSLIGTRPKQRATAKALGLTKLHKSVIHKDNPQIRGMIAKINHLVEVEEVAEE
ncbi:MAG: 50S ribosomal protein L30 [bacterium]|jgi:large subunit ribosomal protein L30|nr:50S ribosomal protein L30 [Bacillota bacterium]HHW54467.1 50S ribosomal protein L30 [Bacillota bacterium]